MSKRLIKLTRYIVVLLIIFICTISMLKSTNNASKFENMTINELRKQALSDSWYNFSPTEEIGKNITSGRDAPYDEIGAYCIDSHMEQVPGAIYKIVNIFDINNNTAGNTVTVYKEGGASKTYPFSEENVKPILALAWLADQGKNETKIYNGGNDSYKFAMASIFLDTSCYELMHPVGISDYIVPVSRGYGNGNDKKVEALKAAEKLQKQGSIESINIADETDNENVSGFTDNDGKYFIGPYKLGLTGKCTINDIKINGNIDAIGISTDEKNVKDVSSIKDGEEFYIVMEKEIEKITSIKATAKEEISSVKARIVVVSGGASQNFIIYRGEEEPQQPSINLKVPEFGKLEIVKEDEFKDSNLNLKDVGFVIWSEKRKAYIANLDGNKISYVDFETAKKNEFKTDQNGVVPTISHLELGKYQIYETSIPSQLNDYYELKEMKLPDTDGKTVNTKAKAIGTKTVNGGTAVISVNIKANQTVKATPKNKRDFNTIVIKKVDQDTQMPLNGIEFKLYSLIEGKEGWVQVDDTNRVKGVTDRFDEASPFVTVNNGQTQKIIRVPLGQYAIYETGLGEYDDIYKELEPIRINGANTGGLGLYKQTVEVKANEENQYDIKDENPQVYISLTGKVWEDVLQGKNEKVINNILDAEDNMINGIEVRLIDRRTNEAIKMTKTSDGGKYKFEHIKIKELQYYYVEFTYDGVTYQNVITPKADSTTKITDENTSKASETVTARKELNKTFTELTGEGQKLTYKKDITLSYTKEINGDIVDVTSNNISDRKKGVDASKKLVNLSKLGDFTIESNTPSDYIVNKYKELEGTEDKGIVREVPNVNLGLYVREQPNLSLEKDVSVANVSINGKTYEYGYEEKLDNEKIDTTVGVVFERKDPIAESLKYKLPVYRADAAYENEDNSKELKISITYRIALINNSSKLYAKINAINENYSQDLVFNKMYIIDNSGKQQEISREENKNTMGDYTTAKFNDLNIKVEPQSSQSIYIKFDLPKDKYYNMATKELDTSKEFRNYAEIASYTIYSDKFDSLYAGFDTNSIPSNSNVIEYEDKTKREDDGDRAPGIQVVDAGDRTISGMVFEDSDKDENDQQRIGDGKYADGENKIEDVKVRLLDSEGKEVTVYDSDKKEFVNQSAKSNENGEFTIKGFIPGDYKVQYTWGEGQGTKIKNGRDTAVTVDAYKSTIWTDENRKEKDSKQWYLQNDPRYSDALDDYNKRVGLDENNADLLKVLDKSVPDINAVSDKAVMTSDTQGIEIGIEKEHYEEVLVNDKPVYKFNIINIDLGLIERPRLTMDISKSVESLRLVTDANQVILDAIVNDEGKLEIQTGSVTGGPSYGYIRGETDSDLIDSGTTAIVGYKVTVKNTSDKDYDSKDYYLYGKEDASKETSLKATAVYDYLEGLSADVEANINWKVLEYGSEELKTETITEKVAQDYKANSSYSNWYSYDNDTGATTYVVETAGEETKQVISEYIEEMEESDGVTFRNLITENRVASKFQEDGNPEIELKAGEQKEVKFYGKQIISSTKDIRFDNDVEVENVIRNGKTGRTVVLEHSNFYDRSEWVTITPPTGEDKDYTSIICISVAVVAILGVGIVFIKKKVLK